MPANGRRDLIRRLKFNVECQAVLYSTDPESGDMFETGNYRRRRRMKRYRTATPYAKPLFRDASGFRTPAHHHHHQLPLGTRNLFGTPSAYPPPYTRYDPRWVHWNTVACWGFESWVWGSVTRRYSFYYARIFGEWHASKNIIKYINLFLLFFKPVCSALRSQWPRGLTQGSVATRLLGLRVLTQSGALMFVPCECCVLSGRGLCVGLITCPEESYRGCACVCACVSVSVIRCSNEPPHL